MFTGIVEEVGQVEGRREEDGAWALTIRAKTVLEDTHVSESIAVNGTCLTVTGLTPESFTVGIAPETLVRTNMADLQPGDGVNLERSLPVDGRLGGHFMQGHVDGTGVICDLRPEQGALWVTVESSPELLRYIVPKGYIAVDGASLTVVDVLPEAFTFMLIAYTQDHIVLPHKPRGSRVNLEVDILGKYVERFLLGTNNAVRPD